MLARPRRPTHPQQAQAPPPLLNHALPFSPQPASSLRGRQSKPSAAHGRTTEDRGARPDVKQADRDRVPRGLGGRQPAQSGDRAAPQGGDASRRPWPQVRLQNLIFLRYRMPCSNINITFAHDIDSVMMAAWLHPAGGPAPESAVAEATRRGVAASARCCLRRSALSARQGIRGAQRPGRCSSSTDTCVPKRPSAKLHGSRLGKEHRV